MDPITVDPIAALGSVAGIVGLTITLVHILKRQCGDIPYLNRVPVIVYAWLVSAVLTYLASQVLHTLEGELAALMVRSVLTAVLAAGTLEIYRSGFKALGDTRVASRARDLREWRQRFKE